MKKKYMKPEGHFVDGQRELRYQANPNYILREIAGENILVPTGKELEIFNGLVTINGTGAFLWKFLEHQRTLEEILDCFGNEYELTREECRNDIFDFLELAIERRIVLRF